MRYVLTATALLCAIALGACQSTPGGVVEKVKYDFGIGEKPEGYVTGTDRVMESLQRVGQSEMKRMNTANRQGEIKFQDEGGLEGKFYKEKKIYESSYAVEAKPAPRTHEGGRGYIGYVDYTYRIYQSPRASNRSEAQAAPATISTNETGRDTFRYTFTPSGTWDGKAGEPVR